MIIFDRFLKWKKFRNSFIVFKLIIAVSETCFPMQLLGNIEAFYAKISDALDSMEQKSKYFGNELSDMTELQNHIMELKDQLRKERNDYTVSAHKNSSWIHQYEKFIACNIYDESSNKILFK